MRRVPKPTSNLSDLLRNCIHSIRSVEKKERFELIQDEVITSATNYDIEGAAAQLYRILPHDMVGTVTSDEMVALYNEKMARKGAPGRRVYDLIKITPKFGICPLCGVGFVDSLDHYLPKPTFPVFATTPINLVPSCLRCNKVKLTYIADTADKQTIHPYYDDFESEIWLTAEIIEDSPPGVLFYARPPDHWSEIKRERAINHLKILQLGTLYASQAGNEFGNLKTILEELLTKGGSEAVRQHLVSNRVTYESNYLNSWQAAFYRALSTSEWFYTTGLRLL